LKYGLVVVFNVRGGGGAGNPMLLLARRLVTVLLDRWGGQGEKTGGTEIEEGKDNAEAQRALRDPEIEVLLCRMAAGTR